MSIGLNIFINNLLQHLGFIYSFIYGSRWPKMPSIGKHMLWPKCSTH